MSSYQNFGAAKLGKNATSIFKNQRNATVFKFHEMEHLNTYFAINKLFFLPSNGVKPTECEVFYLSIGKL